MLHPNKLSTFFVISVFMVTMYITGCAGTKPEDPSFDFTPDSFTNILLQIDNGTLFEIFDNQTYQLKNETGRVVDEGKYTYHQVSNNFAYLSMNNFDVEKKFEMYFDNPVHGRYRFRIVGSGSMGDGNFDIIRGVDLANKAHEKAFDYLLPGNKEGKDFAPEYLSKGNYQFLIHTKDAPILKGIQFIVILKENGAYSFDPKYDEFLESHTGIYYYKKSGLNKAELILDGFSKEKFQLTFQNSGSGFFKIQSPQKDNVYEGIFVRE